MTERRDAPDHAGAASAADNLERQVIDALLKKVERDHVPPAIKRDAHPHMHGCVQAELIVHDDIREDLRQGVFAQPGRRYLAWVRFSNAFECGHDMAATPRGAAIKLLDVEGEPLRPPVDQEARTQDFLLATHDAFFLPDPQEYVPFVSALQTGGLRVLWFFLSKPRLWRGAVALFRSRGVLTRNPLAIPYFSQTPYALGRLIVKLRLEPRMTPQLRASLPNAVAFRLQGWPIRFVQMLPKRRLARLLLPLLRIPATDAWARHLSERIAPHYMLRHAMRTYLAAHDAEFELGVQGFRDGRTTPVDDATKRWSTHWSPFEAVATLRIPRQVFWPAPGMSLEVARATSAMADLGENMSFTPWHGLEAHRPLGSINEIRRTIYERIARFRREKNGVLADLTIADQRASYDWIRAVVQPAADSLPAGRRPGWPHH